MEPVEQIQSENSKLLIEISNLKKDLEKLYAQKGPASSDYISLSIQLQLLIKEYFEGPTIKTKLEELG